jgi:predicted phosphoribosyltransferase
LPENLYWSPGLVERTGIFADRVDAGRILAGLLVRQNLADPLLLAIPAGGMPVAAAAAEALGWPLAAAVVSKILLPWNTEAGYGAVAWDGTLRLNCEMLPRLGLSDEEIEAGVAATRDKVSARVRRLMDRGELAELAGRSAILVDDGLASGFTMLTAVAALKKASSGRIVVAVPTGHVEAARSLAASVDRVLCANLRNTYPFAVAAAYRLWRDVTEQEALNLLRKVRSRPFA